MALLVKLFSLNWVFLLFLHIEVSVCLVEIEFFVLHIMTVKMAKKC